MITIKKTSCPKGAKILKTGQTTSYRTGDDGDLEKGRATDFFTLESNNPFSNTNRFTDELGGQDYTNNIIIDWTTYEGSEVLGYYNGDMTTDRDWNTAIDWGLALSVGTFTSGWRLTNINELTNLMLGGNSAPSGSPSTRWSPLNANGLFVSSTTVWYLTTSAVYINSNYSAVGSTAKTNGRKTLACRDFTVTGTTLT